MWLLTGDAAIRHDGRMTDPNTSNGASPVWLQGATPDELVRVQAIDVQLQQVEATRADLANERRLLTNRACQRARREKSSLPSDLSLDARDGGA